MSSAAGNTSAMRFSSLTGRISGKSADVWVTHYQALERLNAGEKILLLSVGQETGRFTSKPIVEKAIDSLKNGKHFYTPVTGTQALRKAIAENYRQRTGHQVNEDHVAVFAGTQNALYATAQILLEGGDEVIIPEPYYTTYPAAFGASGAKIVAVACDRELGFRLTPDDIAAAVTPRTRAIVLNSPNNPTGAVYSRSSIEAVLDIARQQHLWVISDEVYDSLIDPADYYAPGMYAPGRNNLISISAVSKAYRMTGWRIGWAIAPKPVIEHYYNLNLCMAYGLSEFSQDAAAYAIKHGQSLRAEIRATINAGRQTLFNGLWQIAELDVVETNTGMFVMFGIQKLNMRSYDFAKQLLDQYDVSVLPCDGFGKSGEGYLRASACIDQAGLVDAVGRIREFVEKISGR